MALGIELLYLQDSLTFKWLAESFPSNRLDGAPAGKDGSIIRRPFQPFGQPDDSGVALPLPSRTAPLQFICHLL